MKFLGLSRGLKRKRREFSSERFVEVPQDMRGQWETLRKLILLIYGFNEIEDEKKTKILSTFLAKIEQFQVIVLSAFVPWIREKGKLLISHTCSIIHRNISEIYPDLYRWWREKFYVVCNLNIISWELR